MNELLAGFRRAPGSTALIAARVAAAEIAALPVYLAARAVLEAGPGRSAWFTAGPLDVERVARLGMALEPVLPVAIAAIALGAGLCAITDAAAIRVLAPDRGTPRVAQALREGPADLWSLLKIAAVMAVPASLLLWAVAQSAVWLDRGLERAGASGLVALVVLPGAAAAAGALSLALCSALAAWCRVITLLDGRRRVRRSALLALAAFRAMPAAPLLFVGASAAARGAGLAALVAWRRADPFTTGATPLLVLASLAAVALQAWAWHGLTRGAVLAWTSPRLAAIRSRPDAPLGILRSRAFAPPEPAPEV